MGEDVEVLLRGVDHAERVAGEEPAELGHVEVERVDQDQFLLLVRALGPPGDLDQCELREVRALSMELGVEGVARHLEQLVDEFDEPVLAVDPAEVDVWWALLSH